MKVPKELYLEAIESIKSSAESDENKIERRRKILTEGKIFKIETSGGEKAFLAIQDLAWGHIKATFGESPRTAHKSLAEKELKEAIAEAKDRLAADATLRQALIETYFKAIYSSPETLFEVPRLRVVKPIFDSQARAKAGQDFPAAFAAHRDTWYANPTSQINLWVALHDVKATETFVFYPQLFKQVVQNGSARFEYEKFKTQAGFGNSQWYSADLYPYASQDLSSQDEHSFALKQGEAILFAADHLHRTLAHDSEEMRFSLDLRGCLPTDSEAGLCAPGIDNQSKGNAICDYRPGKVSTGQGNES